MMVYPIYTQCFGVISSEDIEDDYRHTHYEALDRFTVSVADRKAKVRNTICEIRRIRKKCLSLWKTPFAAFLCAWWFVSHSCELFLACGIVLARTLKRAAEAGRWCAAGGAFVGTVIGWICGRDEAISMGAGALAGIATRLLAPHAMKFLPDPELSIRTTLFPRSAAQQ
jgi:hypothetical protein